MNAGQRPNRIIQPIDFVSESQPLGCCPVVEAFVFEIEIDVIRRQFPCHDARVPRQIRC